MKTRNTFYAVSVIAATLALSAPAAFGQIFSGEDLSNQAIASSPRAIEAFPWLTRKAVTRPESKAALVDVTRNRALASSPRMVEQFPELIRPVVSARKAPTQGIAGTGLKNRAVLSSPRTLEEFPWLNRGSLDKENVFQVAPLK